MFRRGGGKGADHILQRKLLARRKAEIEKGQGPRVAMGIGEKRRRSSKKKDADRRIGANK